tara:strand:+ start:60 stop:191 length:132 start_codon:yes stop_codon:yes gene_type:complete
LEYCFGGRARKVFAKRSWVLLTADEAMRPVIEELNRIFENGLN